MNLYLSINTLHVKLSSNTIIKVCFHLLKIQLNEHITKYSVIISLPGGVCDVLDGYSSPGV